MKLFLTTLLLMMALPAAATPTPRPGEAELAARMLTAINDARVENGLAPYALNPLLTQAAQAHSEYQMEMGEISHIGPGDMTALDRVALTGYPFIRVNENIYGGGLSSPEDAVEWWLTADEAHNRNVLHPDMREAGIGAATSPEGWTYYTLDISAQPNVLPMFINSGEPSTTFPNVVITLTNENIFFGSAQIGSVQQVMLSNSADFAGATVVAWSPYVNWTLDVSKGVGAKTVYVRYIDAAGRIAEAQDSIMFDPHARAAATSVPASTLIRTATVTGTATSTATLTATQTATEAASNTPEPTLTDAPTAESLITNTPQATLVAELPTAPPIVITVPVEVPAQSDPDQTMRTLIAGVLLGAIITIVVGLLIFMRRLRASPD